jgi:hypothetical protein
MRQSATSEKDGAGSGGGWEGGERRRIEEGRERQGARGNRCLLERAPSLESREMWIAVTRRNATRDLTMDPTINRKTLGKEKEGVRVNAHLQEEDVLSARKQEMQLWKDTELGGEDGGEWTSPE